MANSLITRRALWFHRIVTPHAEDFIMPSDPFIDIAALSSLGAFRYLDARDQAAFDAGHAPGAVRVPLEAWDKAAKTPEVGFEKTDWWDDALRPLGIGQATIGVAYDTGAMTNAARVWFILQYFGLPCVILNSGWPALSAATNLPNGAGPSPRPGHVAPGVGAVGLVDRATLKQQLDGAAHVFDSRTRAEFTGEDARGRSRSGHLPGARHLSHVDLMQDGVVRPAPELRAMLERVGFGPGDHIVTHCEGGGRAALAAAAAARAGFDDVRVYYLSFGDWARDESCPIVRD
jgi:thiosulfate/3-mercaptopyruvate sulfurtransferase